MTPHEEGTGPVVFRGTAERFREAAALEAMVANVRAIVCASTMHVGWPEHEAQWRMHCPCGGGVPVCEERREAARTHGGILCNPYTCRCTAFHRFDQITWTRI